MEINQQEQESVKPLQGMNCIDKRRKKINKIDSPHTTNKRNQ